MAKDLTEFVLSVGCKGTKSLNVGRSWERIKTESGAVIVQTTHYTKKCPSNAGRNNAAKKAED